MFVDSSLVKVKGVNINRVYKILLKNGINVFKINRLDYKTLTFYVKNKNLKKVFALLNNPCYNVSVEKFYGYNAFKNFLIQKIGLVIACILFFMAICLNCFYVSNIKIYGNEQVTETEIVDSLKHAGIYIGKTLYSIDLQKCEDAILENIDKISLVSVIKKGNCLIVNVKEKLLTEEIIDNNKYGCHIASYSGMITSIELIEGTALVKVGDNVKQGDVVIAGYYIDENGKKVECKAKAKVKAKVWFSSSEIFKTNVLEFKRTGKTVTSSCYYLNNLELFKVQKDNKFLTFEEEHIENYVFKNNILPIKKISTVYYETLGTNVERVFDDYKQEMLEKCYEKARNKIPKNLQINKKFDVIDKTDEGYVVSAYYEAETYI